MLCKVRNELLPKNICSVTSPINLSPDYQWYCSLSQKAPEVCTTFRQQYCTCVCATCVGPCAHARFSSYISPTLEYTTGSNHSGPTVTTHYWASYQSL